MGEIAGRWLRVSSGGQDEANQEPDIDKWIDDHEYETGPTYRLHGKSASKGKQDKALDAVIADMRAGVISVLIVWQSSRIERRGAYSVFDLARRVKEAGGRIEYVQDAYLNETSEMSDVMLALAATKDKQKSDDISKQVTAAHKRSRANGGVITKLGWGFATKGPKYNRRAVTTAGGREYAEEAFQRIADGATLQDVADFLSGVTDRRWFPQTVTAMIRSSSYRGELRDGSGRIVGQCPQLVSGGLWRKANASLDARPASFRGQRSDLAKTAALLSGIVTCGNPECDATVSAANPESPMYKISPREGPAYRCSGRMAGGARRKGCGCLVGLADADALMDRVMSGLLRPVLKMVHHPAEGYQMQIDDIEQKLLDLPARGLTEEAEDIERARLRALRRDYAGRPAKKAWTEPVPVLKADGKPLTWGERWQESDPATRRTWLRDAAFSVSLTTPARLADDFGGDEGDGVLSTVDVYESDTAALIFRWPDDADAGLARGLH